MSWTLDQSEECCWFAVTLVTRVSVYSTAASTVEAQLYAKGAADQHIHPLTYIYVIKASNSK